MNTVRNNNIGDLIKQLASNPDNFIKSMICMVREYIDGSQTLTVEPINSEDYVLDTPNKSNFIYDVRLTSFDPGDIDTIGKITIPKIDSYVIVSFIEDGDKFVSMYSEVETFQVFTETGSKLLMKYIDDVATISLRSDYNSITAERSYIGDHGIKNYLLIESDDTAVTLRGEGDIVIYCDNDTFMYGVNQTNILSDGKVVIDASDDVEIYGSKIKIYNAITDMNTIMSDLVSTLTTNVVVDCALTPPFGAATGAVLAADLIQLQIKINALLA